MARFRRVGLLGLVLLVLGLLGLGLRVQAPSVVTVKTGRLVPLGVVLERDTLFPNYPTTRYGDALFVLFDGPERGDHRDLGSFRIIREDESEEVLAGFRPAAQPRQVGCIVPSDYAPGTQALRIAATSGDSTTIVEVTNLPATQEDPSASRTAPIAIAPGVRIRGSAHVGPKRTGSASHYTVQIGLEAPEGPERYVMGNITSRRAYIPSGSQREDTWFTRSSHGALTFVEDTPFARDYKRLACVDDIERYQFESRRVVLSKAVIHQLMDGKPVPLHLRALFLEPGVQAVLTNATLIKNTTLVGLDFSIDGWRNADSVCVRSPGCVSNYSVSKGECGITLPTRPSADVVLFVERGRHLSTQTVTLPIRVDPL